MKHLLKSLVMGAAFLLAAVPLRAQYGEMPPLHVDGKYLKDPHGNIVNLHGVMDTPNPYFNNYRWGNSCETSGDILKCREYFDKLFAALTDTAQGAWCNIFRLHLDPCWTNDPDLPSQGTETGEANISRFSRVRLNRYLRSLFVPLAESAMEHGLYVVMRPPGVCPGTIQVGGEYQKYLMDVWDAVSSYSKVKEYSGQLFIELANEPVTVLDENGEDTPEALHDFFQPIVDMIRANGYTGVIWVPGSGWQANYKNYALHPITGYNIGYAVHAYVGWYGCDDETATPERFIEEFGKSVPVVETNPILVTEVDWSPESDSNGHYNEHGEWVPGNMGTWATGTTSGWGNSFKAMKDHYGNVGMTLTGTADYIDIDILMETGQVVPAFGGEPEACAQACFDWYADYAQVNVPRADFTYRRSSDNGTGSFVNPIIHADFPDPDVIRVDDTYYLVTTTMYFFPGATILKSKDLVNWEYCANPLQQISNSDAYNLANGWNHYAGGQWAPSLRYRDGKFYLHFVAFDHEEVQDGGGFLLTATDPEGKWEMRKMEGFYYDAGLLFDGENTYVAHGIDNISVTQLDADFKAVRNNSYFEGDAASAFSTVGSEVTGYGIVSEYDLFNLFNIPADERQYVEFTEVLPQTTDGEFPMPMLGRQWITTDESNKIIVPAYDEKEGAFDGAYSERTMQINYHPFNNPNLSSNSYEFKLTVRSAIYEGVFEYDAKKAAQTIDVMDEKKKQVVLNVTDITAKDVFGDAYDFTNADGDDDRIVRYEVKWDDNAQAYLNVGETSTYTDGKITVTRNDNETVVIEDTPCVGTITVYDAWGRSLSTTVTITVKKNDVKE